MPNEIYNNAVEKTNIFINKLNHSTRENYEEFRIMIDEDHILDDLNIKSEGEYIRKFFPIDFEVKTIRNHLNSARLVHNFKINNIDIPLDVNFTALRKLQGSFKNHNHNRRLQYQMKAWEIAIYNNDVPCERDIESAIEEVKITIEKKDKLEQALEKFFEKIAKAKSNEERSYNELPDDVKDVFNESLDAKRTNYFLDELINSFDSNLTTRDLDYHEKLLTQSYTIMQKIIAALRDYEDDQESLREVMDDIYLFTNAHSKAIKHSKEILMIKKQLKEFD